VGLNLSSSLDFAVAYYYGEQGTAITVPLTICIGSRTVDLRPIVDTGASSCVFERIHAENLGLDVESGRLLRFRTSTGYFLAYEHNVTLKTLGIEFDAPVFFAADSEFNRNFVGRSGWLDRVRLAIVHHDQMLYLSPYDS
jgi:predicted aspartyl protease